MGERARRRRGLGSISTLGESLRSEAALPLLEVTVLRRESAADEVSTGVGAGVFRPWLLLALCDQCCLGTWLTNVPLLSLSSSPRVSPVSCR